MTPQLAFGLDTPNFRDELEGAPFCGVSENVRQRMEIGSDRSDYISHLLKGFKSEEPTIPEIEVQASVITLTGSEPASIGLATATYHLLKNINW